MPKKLSRWQELEHEYGLPMRVILLKLYEQYGHESQSVIADHLKISQPTLSQWIKLAGLELKTTLVPTDPAACTCQSALQTE